MRSLRAGVAVVLLAMMSPAMAGVYTDDLSRCLVEKSTPGDKSILVQWIFMAIAHHPSVASLAKVTPQDADALNKKAADLFMRLLTETCEDSTKKAVQYEGSVAIQQAFQVLGQVASRELMSAPEVAAIIGGLEKHLDPKKLESLAK